MQKTPMKQVFNIIQLLIWVRIENFVLFIDNKSNMAEKYFEVYYACKKLALRFSK